MAQAKICRHASIKAKKKQKKLGRWKVVCREE